MFLNNISPTSPQKRYLLHQIHHQFVNDLQAYQDPDFRKGNFINFYCPLSLCTYTMCCFSHMHLSRQMQPQPVKVNQRDPHMRAFAFITGFLFLLNFCLKLSQILTRKNQLSKILLKLVAVTGCSNTPGSCTGAADQNTRCRTKN